MFEFIYFRLKFCLVSSRYSNALTVNSPTFSLINSSARFYYQAILIRTSINGNYTIQSNSTLDSYGFLYLNSFNPNNMIANILNSDDDSAGGGQFLISYRLQANSRYILIMTTFFSNRTTPFSIMVRGPTIVSMSYIETNSTTSTTTSTITSTITQPTTGSTTSKFDKMTN